MSARTVSCAPARPAAAPPVAPAPALAGYRSLASFEDWDSGGIALLATRSFWATWRRVFLRVAAE
jgi:hypothetical protein